MRLAPHVEQTFGARVLRDVPGGQDQLPSRALAQDGRRRADARPARPARAARARAGVPVRPRAHAGEVPYTPIGSRAYVRLELPAEPIGQQALPPRAAAAACRNSMSELAAALPDRRALAAAGRAIPAARRCRTDSTCGSRDVTASCSCRVHADRAETRAAGGPGRGALARSCEALRCSGVAHTRGCGLQRVRRKAADPAAISEALALACEAARRELGLRPYPVQLPGRAGHARGARSPRWRPARARRSTAGACRRRRGAARAAGARRHRQRLPRGARRRATAGRCTRSSACRSGSRSRRGSRPPSGARPTPATSPTAPTRSSCSTTCATGSRSAPGRGAARLAAARASHGVAGRGGHGAARPALRDRRRGRQRPDRRGAHAADHLARRGEDRPSPRSAPRRSGSPRSLEAGTHFLVDAQTRARRADRRRARRLSRADPRPERRVALGSAARAAGAPGAFRRCTCSSATSTTSCATARCRSSTSSPAACCRTAPGSAACTR